MVKKPQKKVVISDSGVITSKKDIHAFHFVLLCRLLSIALAIIGILAFVEGNF